MNNFIKKLSMPMQTYNMIIVDCLLIYCYIPYELCVLFKLYGNIFLFQKCYNWKAADFTPKITRAVPMNTLTLSTPHNLKL